MDAPLLAVANVVVVLMLVGLVFLLVRLKMGSAPDDSPDDSLRQGGSLRQGDRVSSGKRGQLSINVEIVPEYAYSFGVALLWVSGNEYCRTGVRTFRTPRASRRTCGREG